MADAKQITGELNGKWYGRYGVAACPVCQPEKQARQNALTLADGATGLLAHCKKSACDFRDILAAAGVVPGTFIAPNPYNARKRKALDMAEAEQRARQANRVWQEALPIDGTIAEIYLRERSITCPLPTTLRFAPMCWHAAGHRVPALVALVDGGDSFAVHRTYLCPDGSGKADVDPPKAMLGRCTGGAVPLSDGPGPLVVAEGIETALSLLCGLLKGPATVWAALSTSGIRGLRLPLEPHRLTIAPDGDAAGKGAAYALGERAEALGWQVSLLPAPVGRDWNDIIQMKGEAA